jgi:tripartite-type tricarboxylate transporter receptor subunit TctC
MLSRRNLARVCATATIIALSGSWASAQTYPDRGIRMMIAFGSGGTIDTLGRILADKVGEKLGQSITVENRAGGAGNIGAIAASQASPDGYTIHLGAQSLGTNVTLVPTPNFDPQRDFEPVVFVAYAQDVLMVSKDGPYKTIGDLIAAAKAAPGKLNYSSTGLGSSGHLATVLFSQLGDFKAEHVPYTSLGSAVTDLQTGRISFWIATLGGHIGNVQAGAVKALAVSGAERARDIPDVPTFKEQGIALVEPSTWFGVFAPKGTPQPVIAKLNAAFNEVMAEPAMRSRLIGLGYTLVGGPPDALRQHLDKEIKKWAEVAKSLAFSQK